VHDDGGEHDRRMHASVLAGLAVGLIEIDEPGDRGGDQAEDAEPRRPVGAVVDAEEIEDDRDRQAADRYGCQQWMERMPEPRPVEEAPEPRRPDDETADRGVEVRDPDAPAPLVEQVPVDEAPDHPS